MVRAENSRSPEGAQQWAALICPAQRKEDGSIPEYISYIFMERYFLKAYFVNGYYQSNEYMSNE